MLETIWESRWLRNLLKKQWTGNARTRERQVLEIKRAMKVANLNQQGSAVKYNWYYQWLEFLKILRILMTDKTVKCTLKTSYREIIDEYSLKE